MRREQLAACRHPVEQPALFSLQEDARPAAQRTAAGRWREPMLFDG
jgi:hypothetical protein